MTKNVPKTSASQKAKGEKAAPKAARSKPEPERALSALDAAAKVLADAKQPMNAMQTIEAMQA